MRLRLPLEESATAADGQVQHDASCRHESSAAAFDAHERDGRRYLVCWRWEGAAFNLGHALSTNAVHDRGGQAYSHDMTMLGTPATQHALAQLSASFSLSAFVPSLSGQRWVGQGRSGQGYCAHSRRNAFACTRHVYTL